MSLVRKSAGTPDGSGVDKKHGGLHEEWRKPPNDENAIVAGVIMLLKTIASSLPQPQAGCTDEFQPTRDIIASAIQLMVDAGARMKAVQTVGLWSAYSMLTEFNAKKEKLMAEMEQVAKSFTQVQITADTLERWRDVAEWLKALHDITANHSSDFIKDESNFFLKQLSDRPGDYPTINIADSFFKSQTKGVSKYTLVYNFGVAGKNLDVTINAFEAERPKSGLGN